MRSLLVIGPGKGNWIIQIFGAEFSLGDMSALGNLLLGMLLIGLLCIAVFLLLLVLPNSSRRSDWGKLVVGLLATALGIRTLITGYVGHWLYSPQMSASGLPARAAGVGFLVIGLMCLISWVKERRAGGKPREKNQ
ncbi:MAG: hypothetical protein DMF38_10815 [Verrucomicrobia bacterium]|nr:MAG: hypothetical protein DMF38_10815 [Verrucomicrobiota bacterium]